MSGIQIDAGANASDTIGAVLAQALIIEVRKPGGSLVQGAVVRFTALPNDSLPYASAIAVAPLSSAFFSSFATDTTDSKGRAAILVALGSIAGKAGIVVTVPELGYTDTAWYTVKPGLAAHLRLTVRDTVEQQGATWDIGVRVTDRAGNVLSGDSVTYASLNSTATVTTSGHVTAASTGRAAIEVRFGSARDTSFASVVPAGMLVAVRPYTGVYVMNLDGTGLKMLTSTSDFSLFPQWSPDGQRITIYEGNPYGDVHFTAVSLDGARTPIIPSPPSLIGGLAWARPDMNGLVYFSGPRADGQGMAVWRMNADGSGLVRIGTPANTYDFTHPAPSPDGKMVLYDFDPQGIMAINVAAGTVHALGLQGTFPVYSPDGTHIAYLSGASLMIANSDGTGSRTLWTSSGSDIMAPSWTADGKWILAPGAGQPPSLVRVSDGLVLPLPYASTFSQLALH